LILLACGAGVTKAMPARDALPDWQSWEILLNNFLFHKCIDIKFEPLDLMLL
jgi:hypothetical protein